MVLIRRLVTAGLPPLSARAVPAAAPATTTRASDGHAASCACGSGRPTRRIARTPPWCGGALRRVQTGRSVQGEHDCLDSRIDTAVAEFEPGDPGHDLAELVSEVPVIEGAGLGGQA